MAIPDEYSFIRYLAAKKGVDDRALNRHVLQSLETALERSGRGLPLDILEVGAGTGTMLERLAGWGILKNARYEAIDLSPDNIGEAVRLVPLWARYHGFKSVEDSASVFCLERGEGRISVRFEAIDLYPFMERERGRRNWDLLIAHAFLDLVDATRVLPGLISLTRPGGLLSLTMNFDGLTILEPPVDAAFDREILALYHQSMDSRVIEGQPSGDSLTGRHLLTRLREQGVAVLAAGSSDWVVFPGSDGYPRGRGLFPPFHHQPHRYVTEGTSPFGSRPVFSLDRHPSFPDRTMRTRPDRPSDRPARPCRRSQGAESGLAGTVFHITR